MGVVLEPLVVPVMELCAFAVALGIIYMLHGFVRAAVGGIAGLIGHVPGIGGVLSSPVNAVYHWMDTEFGKVEGYLDARMASALHTLARLFEWIGKEFRLHGELLLALATLASNPFSVRAWRTYFSHLLAAAHDAQVAIRHATTGHIGAAIHAAVRPVALRVARLDAWTHTQIRVLRHSIAVTIPRDIAGLRARTRAIEDRFASVYDRLRKMETALGIGAMTAVVAVALSRLGLGWIRCGKLRERGPALCNMDDALWATLLADTLAIVGTVSIVELARELQAAMPEVTAVIRAGIREAR